MAKVYRPIGSKYIHADKIACGPDMGTSGYANVQTCLDSDLYRLRWMTILPNGTDLNDIRTPGAYRSWSTSTTSTMLNVPKGQTSGFQLLVIARSGGNILQNTYECMTQEVRRDCRIFLRHTWDYGATWSDWVIVANHKIGDIIITSDNAGAEQNEEGSTVYGTKSPDLAARLGGEWTLIDKEFSTWASSSETNGTGLTINSTNCSGHSTYWSRQGHILTLRTYITYKTDLDDTAGNLATIDYTYFGITQPYYTLTQVAAFSDGGGGFVMWSVYWDTGIITHVEKEADASATSGDSYYGHLTFNMPPNNMIDSACDKFYWKRTA